MNERRLYEPNPNVLMSPLAGLQFLGDAIRGDWTRDGRTTKVGLDEYIRWGESVDASTTTEADILPRLESMLGVYVVEEWSLPDYHDRKGTWAEHAEDEIQERDGDLL